MTRDGTEKGAWPNTATSFLDIEINHKNALRFAVFYLLTDYISLLMLFILQI